MGGSNTSGVAGQNVSGAAGQTQSGLGGSNPQGAAGSPGTAGSDPQGTAGSTGVAGSNPQGSGGSAGGTTGAAGSAPIADMIDNLDDNDGKIIQANGRQGPWHSFNNQSNGGNQVPSGTGTFTPASGGANSTSYAVHTTGSGYSYAGVGFDLNNSSTPESMQSQSYNASAFTGISFWAKGNGNLRIEFAQKAFVPTANGGSCSSGSCWNVYGTREIQGKLDASTWKQFTVMFNSASMQREDGSKSPAFDPSQLMSISFKHEGSSFDFWLDEIQFIGGSGNPTGVAGSSGSAGRGGSTGAAGAAGSSGVAGSGPAGSSGAAGSNGFNEPMPPQITSGGQNAWASRYWDCCKPACGWTGNTGGKTPIKSCNMQNQPLSGYNDRNACESGGTAYACWGDAPFQVGPNLSYGFAAASGSNYSCGRCYQLQFNGSGHNGKANSLNGKMMIVQVVNNGGVASDQFDLLIPGGGVGALNACANQWKMSDLGAQYGGFLAGCNGSTSCVMQKCQTVFGDKPDLMAGCQWFLGWFGAADNPNMVVKEIACPELLKSRGLR